VSFVLDTCALSETARPSPDAGFMAWLDRQDSAALFLSVLTIGEIEKGLAALPPGRKRTTLSNWLGTMRSVYAARVLPIDDAIAALWGRMAADAERRGRAMSVVDGLIAATARHHGYAVVTRNASDFEPSGVPVLNPWSG
jgi:predicted nucleic acid-binding protein